MRFLRQNTSIDLPVGPFLSTADGFTAMGALTITQPDVLLKKNGASPWAQKNAAQTLLAESHGFYEVTLDTTDTNTLGLLRLSIQESGALPVWEEFMIMPANVWDSLFAADKLQVDAVEWLGTAAATPTVAGVPEVDLTHLVGVAQSAADLKDFADDGYDPSTNKVQGLVLADAATVVNGLAANVITATAIAAGALTAAKFASDAFDAVWTVASRLLTAGTNIVLAKGTGITGLNDLSAAQVNTEVDTALADVNLDHLVGTSAGIPAIPAGTYLDQIMDDGTATYDRTTDSLQSIRDRGDTSWGGAGSGPTAVQIADEVQTRTIAAVTTVNGLAANAITATSITTGAVTAAKFSAGAIDNAAFAVTEVLNANVQQWNGQAVATPSVSGVPEVDVTHLEGDATALANLRRSAVAIYRGSVTGTSTTTAIVDSSLTQTAANFWKGRIVLFTSGSLQYQVTEILGFDPATDTLTVTVLTAAPSVADQYVVL